MKKLLKSEICGSVNNARMHCSRTKSQQVRLPKKKKKKGLKHVESKTWTQEAESKQSLKVKTERKSN